MKTKEERTRKKYVEKTMKGRKGYKDNGATPQVTLAVEGDSAEDRPAGKQRKKEAKESNGERNKLVSPICQSWRRTAN